MDTVPLSLRAIAALAAVCVILKVLEWIRCMKILGKLPAPDGNLFLGQLPVLARSDHHNVLAQWAAQFGGIYRMRLAHKHVRLRVVFRRCCSQEVAGQGDTVLGF